MKKLLLLCTLLYSQVLIAQNTSTTYFFVKTTGPLPFLEYGPGDDRLGGAKMTYLDTNIVLKVVDSFLTDYKVQLSKNHSAYIAKENVTRLPNYSAKPYYLTSSWKVSGDSLFDYVAISLDEKLPYKTQQLINPSKIAVDIFGATSNTNWITQLKSNKEIKNVYYEQLEDDVFRAVIELKHIQHWGHSVYYDSLTSRLTIKVKRPPATPDIKKLRIAIDAGHGGDNAGATGINLKLQEKDYTLRMAKELKTALKKAGVKNIFMTRDKDTSLSMVERTLMLRAYDPQLMISIHLNSSARDSISGTSTYYRYIGYRSLTTSILNHMLTLGLKEFGNIGSFNFALSGPTEYPNCLVEVAFLSNAEDEKKVASPKFQTAVGQKIYLGIADWLKQAR